MTAYEGQCHCGQIQWEVTLDENQHKHVLCHCDTCKILGGGAFTLNQIIPKSLLKFTKGGDDLKVYTYKGNSGNAVNCYYCPTCTAHPYHHQEVLGPDKIILRTSLLPRGRAEFQPAVEIWGKAKMPWEKEVAKTFEVMPPPA